MRHIRAGDRARRCQRTRALSLGLRYQTVRLHRRALLAHTACLALTCGSQHHVRRRGGLFFRSLPRASSRSSSARASSATLIDSVIDNPGERVRRLVTRPPTTVAAVGGSAGVRGAGGPNRITSAGPFWNASRFGR